MVKLMSLPARESFFLSYPKFWHDIDDKEYAVYGHMPMEHRLAEDIRAAAFELSGIFNKMANVLRSSTDEALINLGFPEASISYLRMEVPKKLGSHSTIGRFDFCVRNGSIKMLEFNADTPTFIVESFKMNGQVCNSLNVYDTNVLDESNLSELLTSAINRSRTFIKRSVSNCRVAFTATKYSKEDLGTAEYLCSQVNITNCIKYVVPLEDLRITEDALLDANGNKIDVLYRLYPIEFLIDAVDEESGEPIGKMLLDLVARKKLAIVNPITAFLMQPKSIQAAIWGLRGERKIFKRADQKIIEKYMLPTYMDADPFTTGKYVKKSILGRKGNTISIIDSVTGNTYNNGTNDYDGKFIYQEYSELPKSTVVTREGAKIVSYITTCFVIDGVSSAIGIRAGGLITDNDSHWIPVSELVSEMSDDDD